MNIGVDIRVLGSGRAVSRYTKNILSAISRIDREIGFYLFTDSPDKAVSLGIPEGAFRVVNIGSKLTIRDHLLFKREIDKYPLDIFFHPDNTEFLYCHRRSVVTIHDLIPWLYPNLVLSSDPFINFRQRGYLRLQEKAFLESAGRVLTVSLNSREDIIRVLKIDPDLITVTYEGINNTFHPENDKQVLDQAAVKYNLPKDFIFYVGGLDERKNVLHLIHAFAKVVERHRVFLVIGGKTDGSETEGRNSFTVLKREIENLGLASSVIFTGFIDERDLPAVYSLARTFVYPSFYEGFGLPPLEAMACGTPVICSSYGSLKEICGQAALFINPYETADIYSALDLILRDEKLSSDYREKGLIQSGKYRWEDCARKTLAVFRDFRAAV